MAASPQAKGSRLSLGSVLHAVSDVSNVEDRTTEGRARHHRAHLLAYVFLISLAGCVNDVVSGTAAPRWLSGGALAAFVACYVVFVETHPHTTTEGSLNVSRGSLWLRGGALALLAGIAFATTLAYGDTWMVLFIFVVVTLAASLPLRVVPLAIVAVAGAVVLSNVAGVRTTATMITGASWALSTVMAGYIALLLRRRGVLIGELRSSRGEVARLAAVDAVADERLRFARDLHDLLGHSLSVIVLKAELARRLLDAEQVRSQARDEVSDVEQIARRALEEVREAVTGYRVRSLAAEVERSRVAVEAAGVEARIEVGAGALPADVETLLAQVVREATTNVVRHSKARHVSIVAARSGGEARLEINDDGIGAAAGVAGRSGAAGGTGLRGLSERISQAGGTLAAGPRPEGGFRVTAVVPCGTATGSPPGPGGALAPAPGELPVTSRGPTGALAPAPGEPAVTPPHPAAADPAAALAPTAAPSIEGSR